MDAGSERDLDEFVQTTANDLRIDDLRRTGWIRRQADEQDSLGELALTLAERSETVSVTITNGHRLVGRICLVGVDVLGVQTRTGRSALVSIAALGSVRYQGRQRRVAGDRTARLDATMASVVSTLAEEQVCATVFTGDGDNGLNGVIERCGLDVVTMQLDGSGEFALVPMSSITYVVVEDNLW